eukprot:Opistho-1_new@34100
MGNTQNSGLVSTSSRGVLKRTSAPAPEVRVESPKPEKEKMQAQSQEAEALRPSQAGFDDSAVEPWLFGDTMQMMASDLGFMVGDRPFQNMFDIENHKPRTVVFPEGARMHIRFKFTLARDVNLYAFHSLNQAITAEPGAHPPVQGGPRAPRALRRVHRQFHAIERGRRAARREDERD